MDILNRLKREEKIVLYGQEDYISRISNYLDLLFPNLNKVKFNFRLKNDRVDSVDLNFSMYDDDLCELKNELFFVAFSKANQSIVTNHLKKIGVNNHIIYNAVIDNSLKKKFFYKYMDKDFILLDDVTENDKYTKKCIHIYQARSVYDKGALEIPKNQLAHLIPMQVGAALTKKRIADITDATGYNISARNRRYSEMTAFYWMWKNDKEADYLGICHYRRLWVDLDKIAEKLQTTNIDVVLPLPTLCEHSVHEDYLLKHIPTVWKPMMEVMKKYSPEYYEVAKEIFKGKIFYASNMCIIRREVLNDLCEWMFPIVMEVEKVVGDIEDAYYNRYAGFCTERLITLYFLYNKSKWKIAHAEKYFIG